MENRGMSKNGAFPHFFMPAGRLIKKTLKTLKNPKKPQYNENVNVNVKEKEKEKEKEK